jgi:hypothetical protein
MPDFDKDLQPIIKGTESIDLQPNSRAVKDVPLNVDGGPSLSGTSSVFDELAQLSSRAKPNVVRPFVTDTELAANKRYSTFNPTIENQEDFAAYGQSTSEKAINGILKGTNLAATTIAGGFAMLGGAIKWALPGAGGKFSDIWDNPVMQNLDKWNEKVDNEFLPNYYTQAEKDAKWYSTGNWMTANFLFDKLIKNSGFAVGAMVSGNIANAALGGLGAGIGALAAEGATLAEGTQAFKLFTPLLRNTARAFGAAKNVEAASILEGELSSIADLSAKESAMGQISRTTNKFAKIGENARRSAIAAYSSAGEASFEALQTSKEFRNNLIEDFKRNHGGLDPEGEDLKKINETSESVGKASFLGNLALLGVTEYLQLPKLLGSSYSASRKAANSLIGEVGDVVLDKGVYAAAKATTKFGKIYDKAIGVGKYVFDPKEAAQENLQYALQIGAQNYYNKAYRTNQADALIDGVMYGFTGVDAEGKEVGSLVSKEGIESAILGGITGGLMQARGTFQEDRAIKNNTAKFLDLLNGSPEFKSAFVDRMNSINRAVILQQEEQAAILQGDKLEAKDLQADQMHNYLATRIKYGRFDMVADDIRELRMKGATEQGLAELKEEGVANINDTIESYRKKLDNFEKVANNTNEIYKATDLRFSGEKNEEGGRKYSPELIDKMVYAAAKISNYELRIPATNESLVDYGINTGAILDSIIEQGKPNKTATKEALKQIADLDVISTIKDELKTNLSDVIEMSLRRKLYMTEYDAMKGDPEDYTLPDEEIEAQMAKIKQQEIDEEGKKKTKTMEVEVGKEYSLRQAIRREGNTLQVAPKIKVLSKTLGGEYEVQTPSGDITFLKPEQFKQYAVSTVDNTDEKLTEMLDNVIDKVLATPMFPNVSIPEGMTKLQYVNSLGNPALVDAIEKEFNKQAEEYIKQKEEAAAKQEKLANIKGPLKTLQDEENSNAGEDPTPEGTIEEEVTLSTPVANKIFSRLFTSSTSPNENKEVLAPHAVRLNTFLNNVKNFKNKGKLQAIMFTYKQQKALGLDGVIETAWRTEPGKFTDAQLKDVNDPKNGNVMIAFVQVDKSGKINFVDSEGNALSEVGQQVDLDKVVFATMPTAQLYTVSKSGDKTPRFRAGEEKEAETVAALWEDFRLKKLFEAPDTQMLRYTFQVSKGKPIINKEAPEKNAVGGVLVPEDKIVKEQVLVVPTKGAISHTDGENYKFPNGRPVIVYGDTLQLVNNNNLNDNQVKTIYGLLKELSDVVNSVASSGAALVFDAKKRNYLRNVLYWSNKETKSANRIYINENSGQLHIGEKSYDLANVASNEASIKADLAAVFHNVNEKTLAQGMAEPFYEYYIKDGKLQPEPRVWKNYQSYLLSSKYPDGSSRSLADTPITTSVAKPTNAVPYSYTQKYAFLEGLDLGYEDVKPAPAAQLATGDQVYDSVSGKVGYTVSGPADSPVVEVSTSDDTVKAVAKDVKKLKAVQDALMGIKDQNGNILFDDLDTAEESVAKYYSYLIKGSLIANAQAPAPAAPDQAPAAPADRQAPQYSRVGFAEYDPMSQFDIEAFKEWAKEKLPTMPYEYLENMIRTFDGRDAFGKLEKGVVSIFKKGARGTEYHEAFHFVFNGFLSPAQREAIYNEFRSKTGSFTDKVSGKKYDYNDPDVTDLMIEERIADDFAEFRLGKLPARTLGEKISRFFKAIMDFFKSFVAKPSLKDDLFKSIETGEFAEKEYPDTVKTVSARFSEIPGMSEQKINDYVQDITAEIFNIVFADNRSLFNPEAISSAYLFASAKEKLSNYPPYANLSALTWSKLIDRTKAFLKSYRIEFDENSKVTINDEDATKNEYASDAFTVDFKKSSPYAVKLLVGTLIETKKLVQKTSLSLELPAAATSSVGFKLVPFDRAFATLLNHLENIKDPYLFSQQLVELAREKSEYVRLFKRLGGNMQTGKIDFSSYDSDAWRLFSNFYQVFTKQKPEAIKQFKDGLRVSRGSANQTSSSRELQNEWIENMIVKANGKDPLIARTGNYYTVYQGEIAKLPIGNAPSMIDFLSKLGINFPADVYAKLKGNQPKKFAEAVLSIHLGLRKGSNTVSSLKSKSLDIRNGLSTLAALYTNVTSTDIKTTLVNSEGDQRQEFTESNAPSYFEYIFNSVETLDELKKKMPQLNDVFSTHSQILKQGGLFFDEEGNRTGEYLKVQYIDGQEDLKTESGKPVSKFSIGDRFTTEINQNLNGSYYVLIPADGSTEWMMNVGNPISYGQFLLDEDMSSVHEIFKGYLKDEIALAQDAKNRKNLKNVGNKASELRFFKDILYGALATRVNGLVSSKANDEQIETFLQEQHEVNVDGRPVMKTNLEMINDAVDQFIQGTAKETFDLLNNNSQFVVKSNRNGVLTYSYEGLDSNFAEKNGINKLSMKEEELMGLLKFTNINYVINNIEYHKVLFGDPYQFKIKDGILDETKRIKSFLSPRRFTFNMTEYNNFLNDSANNVSGIALTDKDYGYHEFKDYLKTLTVKDVKIRGKLAELFGAYDDVDESDASSWISAEAYREVKMKNGQWSDEAEAFHQWQMAYTRQNIPGYEYTNDELREHDEVLMRTAMPKYVIEVLKPIVSGNKYGKTNIDLVLDKFSQVPIYYSAVKGTNLENLYKKMFDGKYDYVVVESGRKVGAEGLRNLYNPNGSFNEAAFENPIKVPWDAYGIQVENSYDKEKLQTRGSQLTKLATLDLFSNGVPNTEDPERAKIIKAAVEKNTEILRELVANGYNSLIKRLGIEDLGDEFVIKDKSEVAKALRGSILTQQLSTNAIDSITLDSNGQFVVPFEASTNYTQIKNMLYSIVNKSIISPKMNGFPGVQVSAAMWESASEGRQLTKKNDEGVWENITKEQYEALDDAEKKEVMFTSSTLKFYEDEKGKRYCEVLLPNWMRSKFDRRKFKTDESIFEYLNTDEGRKILSGIGFRIPTQALSSVEVFRVKGFLPEYMGRTVVVPSEITKKAGSDFDIDKLNMYLKSVYKDAAGNVRLIEYKGSEWATKEFYGRVYDDINSKEDKGTIGEQFGELLKSLIQEEEEDVDVSRENFVNTMYAKALENAYYESLEELLTLPENFKRLVSPNTDQTLKDIAKDIDELEGVDETNIKNRLLDRNYMTSLRHAFITAKKWVGIAAVNITGNSLAQKTQVYVKNPSFTTFLPHNTVTVEGREHVTMSTVLDKAGKYISDKLSEYANAFVDVAKDPYILKIVYSDRIVGTFMALERIGVPTKTAALFMNQPIIKSFVKYLDSSNQGLGGIYDEENINFFKQIFNTSLKATPEQLSDPKTIDSILSDNIKKYAKSEAQLSDADNAMQHLILDEFLKLYDLGKASYELTQAINYDTTTFRNADELYRKNEITKLAEEGNMFVSPKQILESSFLGDVKEALDRATKALGTILKFNQDEFRGVLQNTLKYYATNPYISPKKFAKIAEKASASFLDYIIYIKGSEIDLKKLVVDENNVAERVLQARERYPDIKMLSELTAVTGPNADKGAKTLRLKASPDSSYAENTLIGYMREMRNHPSEEIKQLYDDLITLSITQGTFRTANSFKRIIPLEDYARVVSPIIDTLVIDTDIREFAKSNWFQKNNWNDKDIVPNYSPTFWGGRRLRSNGEVIPLKPWEPIEVAGSDPEGNDLYQYYSPTIVRNDALGATRENRMLLEVFSRSRGAGAPVITIPRIVPAGKKRGPVDFVSGVSATEARIRQVRNQIGSAIDMMYGYERVDVGGSPLFTYDDKGNGYYVYKAVNLHGDGPRAVEYGIFPDESVIDNNTHKVTTEIPTKDIVTLYNPGLSDEYMRGLLDNNMLTTEFLKASGGFQGTIVKFVDEIVTDRDIPVAMRNINKGERIEMVEKLMNQKFDEKAWTNPATQKDGSKATALPEDSFNTFNEFLTFAMLHEKAHEYIMKDEKETIGEYEDRINNEALARLKERVGDIDFGTSGFTSEDFKC